MFWETSAPAAKSNVARSMASKTKQMERVFPISFEPSHSYTVEHTGGAFAGSNIQSLRTKSSNTED